MTHPLQENNGTLDPNGIHLRGSNPWVLLTLCWFLRCLELVARSKTGVKAPFRELFAIAGGFHDGEKIMVINYCHGINFLQIWLGLEEYSLQKHNWYIMMLGMIEGWGDHHCLKTDASLTKSTFIKTRTPESAPARGRVGAATHTGGMNDLQMHEKRKGLTDSFLHCPIWAWFQIHHVNELCFCGISEIFRIFQDILALFQWKFLSPPQQI